MIIFFFEWLVPVLYLLSFAGLAWIVARAITSGMQTYSGEYTAATAQKFEDVFLFIPPERIRQIAWGTACGAFIIFFPLSADWTSFGGMVRVR